VLKEVPPFPPLFPDALSSYCEQAAAAAKRGAHHDTRRHLFLNFLRENFNVRPFEVELEQKIKVGEVRGRIDALFRHIIVEVKTDFGAERDARKFTRERVAGKLARLDELTRKLLGSGLSSRRSSGRVEPQGNLL